MSANERQVGGDHYKTAYQPWDLIVKIPVGYLEGNVIRYVSRWRKKNGLQDLEKGMHYLDKLIEVVVDYDRVRRARTLMNEDIITETFQFCKANNLTHIESECITFLCIYQNLGDLQYAKEQLEKIIKIASLHGIGTPEDGGHHARQRPQGDS